MKEIQEEEERKKAQGASSALSASISDAAFLSAAARRETIRPAELPKVKFLFSFLTCSYLNFILSQPTAPTGGSAWAVVGPGGKHIPSPAVTSPTPIATTSNRSSAVNARSASTVSSTPAARPTTAAASTTSTTPSSSGGNAKKVDVKMHPSVDFMRWLRDALRGLNHGVSVEEFITMLFDLPLDPDLSMLDVISDFVYANSSTMDGRRFASEFVNKRKADSAKVSQMGNGGVGAGSASNGSESGKSVSLADVVKSQPKPAQPDWGYKVVTKKKGKRS
ncbi:uncharacterized protein EI90DRAFT_2930901 [Cantharellus anzutake]|uniref:uncharacterized protein n=1 Tax=Cantharellus anzutake TaxID=1750568 RepID=UPI001908AF25|nr:uncharacterized protein EI90DRAFT_2930901 [Cantharellus anzutake]KAF8326029.1 hypothetical protein EI90DRAFT_2930901 [Cantharellus anzutake]